MTPPERGACDAADPSEPPGSVPPFPPSVWLDRLHDYDMRLGGLLKEVKVRPELLDDQANEIHENMVIPAYQLMTEEAAGKSEGRWGRPSQRRFDDRYQAIAGKWPAYRLALAELNEAPKGRKSEAMMRLETPRTGYIRSLRSFYDEFTGTLHFLFPG